jgi:plasmid rolling circle replication initiator protein Rep
LQRVFEDILTKGGDLLTFTNNIIAQNVIIVNSYGEKNSFFEKRRKTLGKWEEKKLMSLQMGAKMNAVGETGRAFRMAACGQNFAYNFCDACNNWQLENASLCRDRLCPLCMWRLSLRRYARMLLLMREVRENEGDLTYSFVTLTIRNCDVGDLSDTIKAMSTQWNRIMSRRTVKRVIAGTARSLEFTYNKQTQQIHPHYHVIVAWRGEPQMNMLAAEWCAGLAEHTHVDAQNEQLINNNDGDEDVTGAVLETYKYAVKGSDLMAMPLGVFKEFVKQIKGKRLTSFTGDFKLYYNLLFGTKSMDDIEDEERVEICRNCGSDELTKAIAEWSGTGYQWR